MIALESKNRIESLIVAANAQNGGTATDLTELVQELLDRTKSLIDKSITEIRSNAEAVGNYAFYNCQNLATANLPAATSIGNYAFAECFDLVEMISPAATSIGNCAFSGCAILKQLDLPAATSIGSYAFRYCYAFRTLVLRSSAIVSLANKNAFNDTYINDGSGYIYVPAPLLAEYQVATNWSNFASQFRALEDYTEDGTITGALDKSKI